MIHKFDWNARVQVVNIKKGEKRFLPPKIWRTPCSNSEDPLGVPDPLLKTPGVDSKKQEGANYRQLYSYYHQHDITDRAQL